MRRITKVIAIIIVGGIGVWYYVASQPEEYKAPEVITNIITEEVEVDVLEQMVVEAISASSTETHLKAQADYDASVQQSEKEIELDVRRGQQKEAELRIEELEKQVGQY